MTHLTGFRAGERSFPHELNQTGRVSLYPVSSQHNSKQTAKILHSIEATYKNIDNPLTDRENEILKIPKCEELRSFVDSLRAERLGPRIRWETLAHLLRVPFQTEICQE